MPNSRRERSAAHGFWTYSAVFTLVMVVASTPSPLYPLYQEKFGFSAAVLTMVFAIYVVGMLVTMLTAGSLSDHIGRRPVMLLGIGLVAVATVVFATAGSTAWLLVARAVQGVGTGLVSATASAGTLDTNPPEHPGAAAVASNVVPSVGLATGGLLAGVFVEAFPAPLQLVWWVLLGVLLLCALAMLGVTETSALRPGALASLRPRVGIPAHLRSRFLVAAPCWAACWGTGGIYLALGTSMVKSVLGIDNALVGGLAIAALWVPGIAAPFIARSWTYLRMMWLGAACLGAGMVSMVLSFRAVAPVPYFISTALMGFGFGILQTSSYGTVASHIRGGERGAVVSTFFVINYVAFSAPAVVAGFLTARLGLQHASEIAAGWVVLLCAIALVQTALRRDLVTR
ncbi:MFS transporter [Cumulibacter manganitolerans]|uniref:MFS transporter n=1 Tax=Cumulibacter manganitolerans TaxID=1884992 RepID=UPI001295BCF7|nr:MFS transporter [Cumulibacter manganitolerans]